METRDNSAALWNWAKLLGIYAVILFLLFIFVIAQDFLTPFLIAFILVYLLTPVVDRIEGMGIKRVYVVAMIFLGSILALALIGFLGRGYLLSEFNTLKDQVPGYFGKMKAGFSDGAAMLEKQFSFIPQGYLTNIVDEKIKELPKLAGEQVPKLPGMIISMLTNTLIVLFTTFFFLKDGREMRKSMIRIIPNKYFETFLCLLDEINQAVGAYIRGQILDCSIVAVLSVIGLYAIGLKYALIIGILSGAFNIIPYLGPIMGMVPGIAIAIIDHHNAFMAVEVVAVLAFVQLIDNSVVSPLAVGKSVDLHPLAVIVSVSVGGALLGVWGMLLAVPIFCALKVTFEILHRGIVEYGNWEKN
jgi:predicted PurR-regulated permease PerM